MSSSTQAISLINQVLQDSVNAGLVYGEPVNLGNKIVLPMAKIALGFGGGGMEISPTSSQASAQNSAQADPPEQAGSGGGGGMIAYPAGVFEISEKETRFIAASNKAVWGFSLAVAFMLGAMLKSRPRRSWDFASEAHNHAH